VRKLLAVFLILALRVSAAAADDGQAIYFGGTVPALAAGAIGRLDTASETSLTFDYTSNKLAIPYTSIESFRYSTEVAHHLGVLPAIAVGLVKKRERRHFFRISYRDANGTSQVALFEVPKRRSPSLKAVLETRVSRRCKTYSPCANPN
jgi:hypothetical protein